MLICSRFLVPDPKDSVNTALDAPSMKKCMINQLNQLNLDVGNPF
jgi:hypothetical protein